MRLNNSKCCNNFSKIADILASMLFMGNSKIVLNERYMQMINNCNDPHQKWGTCAGYSIVKDSKDVLLEVPIASFPGITGVCSYSNLGHDIPFWIEGNENKPRIMLVSQDPLRRKQKSGSITLSTPFGMHSIDYRGNRLMTQIVYGLVEDKYSVYLTDYNKLYGDHLRLSGMSTTFSAIFREEVEFFKPTKIFAVGKVAQQALPQTITGTWAKTSVPILPLYHPNARFKPKDLGYKTKIDYFYDKLTK